MGKKIDDNILLDMISQGKEQKEAAAYFGVSPAAICKRLKRLQSGPDAVLEKYGLTDKEKAFCIAKAQGQTNVMSALAGYEVGSIQSAKAIGTQLMKKAEVQLAISELMESEGLTRSYRLAKVKKHVDNPDPNVSLKALDMTWKLDGSYIERHQHQVAEYTFMKIDLSRFANGEPSEDTKD